MKRSEIQTGKTYHNISKPPFYAERKVTAIFKSQAEEDGRQYVRFHTITGPISRYEREGYPDGELALDTFARWAAGIVK